MGSENSYFIWSLIGLLALAFSLLGLFYWWVRRPYVWEKRSLSPYTGLPLRHADTLHYKSIYKVQKYLHRWGGFDNPPIDFHKAAYCRETGRIFPNTVNWLGNIQIDWSFISKRLPGDFVSWGSLPHEKQEELRYLYGPFLEGFQTEYSSKNPSPSKIEKEYAYRKPGPLYVDVHRNTLMGWLCVPDSDLEILIIRRPLKRDYR